MSFQGARTVFVSLLFCSALCQTTVAGDDLYSMIDGTGALVSLNTDLSLQKILQLTPEQAMEVKSIGSTLSLDPEARAYNDAEVRRRLAKILTVDQLLAVRTYYLRGRLHSPISVWQPRFLREVGVAQADADECLCQVWVRIDDLNSRTDASRSRALDAIVMELPPTDQRLFWAFFGRDLKVSVQEGGWESIAVLADSSVSRQLALAPAMLLPGKLEITVSQRNLLLELWTESLKREAKRAPFTAAELSKELDMILSPDQRFALVQRIQQQNLRGNLEVAMAPPVAKRLAVSEDTAAQIRKLLSDAESKIRKERKKDEFEILSFGLKNLPVRESREISRLTEGLWEQ